MCGIAGLFRQDGLAREDEGAVRRMIAALHHRGPDSGGLWLDGRAGIALGHRRLAILDISDNGAQPMASVGGRYVITFNGEIYNWASLKRRLESDGARFRGHSDTEVMLAAFDRWGVVESLSHLAGMFAFALWDRHDRSLFLARDRLGEKPLYLAEIDGATVFASELHAFRAHPQWQGRVDESAAHSFLATGWVPAPATIYSEFLRLRRPAGSGFAKARRPVMAATGHLPILPERLRKPGVKQKRFTSLRPR